MDGTALAIIDALLGCNAISKVPRAADYRASDFVPWHSTDPVASVAIVAAYWGIAGALQVVTAAFNRRQPAVAAVAVVLRSLPRTDWGLKDWLRSLQ